MRLFWVRTKSGQKEPTTNITVKNAKSWSTVTSEWRYSHYDKDLHIRNSVDIAPAQATKRQWHYQQLFLASWSSSKWKVKEMFFLTLKFFGLSLLYIRHCHSDYISCTLTSHITNSFFLISSKWLTLGLQYLDNQLTKLNFMQCIIWRYLVISLSFSNSITNLCMSKAFCMVKRETLFKNRN